MAMAVSPGPERAALGVRRAKALILAGDVPGAIETLATFEHAPPSAEGQHQVVKGLALWCTGALDDAEAAGREAKRIAERTGNLRDFVDATMVLAMVAHERGVWPQRLSLDLLDAHIRPDLAAVVMDAHLCIAESYLYGGVPFPEIIRFAEDLRHEAQAAASPRPEAFATTLLGQAHLLMGDTEWPAPAGSSPRPWTRSTAWASASAPTAAGTTSRWSPPARFEEGRLRTVMATDNPKGTNAMPKYVIERDLPGARLAEPRRAARDQREEQQRPDRAGWRRAVAPQLRGRRQDLLRLRRPRHRPGPGARQPRRIARQRNPARLRRHDPATGGL